MGRLIIRAILATIITFICIFICCGLVYGAGLPVIILFVGFYGGIPIGIFIVNRIIPAGEKELAIREKNIQKNLERDWAGCAIWFILFILGFFFPLVWVGMLIAWLSSLRK